MFWVSFSVPIDGYVTYRFYFDGIVINEKINIQLLWIPWTWVFSFRKIQGSIWLKIPGILLLVYVIRKSNSNFMPCPTGRFPQCNTSCLNTYWGLSENIYNVPTWFRHSHWNGGNSKVGSDSGTNCEQSFLWFNFEKGNP